MDSNIQSDVEDPWQLCQATQRPYGEKIPRLSNAARYLALAIIHDYYYPLSEMVIVDDDFRRQLTLAEELIDPIAIEYDDMINIIEKEILPNELIFRSYFDDVLAEIDQRTRCKHLKELSAEKTEAEGGNGDTWDNPAYITNSEAVKLSEGKISLSQLSKRVTDGTILGVRKGQRCKVHIDSLREHLKTLGGDIFSEDAFERYFADAEQCQATIRERKKAKR